MHKVFVTGSSGLIGSAAVEYYDRRGSLVHGADNNMHSLESILDQILTAELTAAAGTCDNRS